MQKIELKSSLFYYLCIVKLFFPDRMNKQPKLMNLSRMRDIFALHSAQLREQIYFSDEIGIVHGDRRLFQYVIQQNPPFAIDDYRFGVLIRGQAVVNFNLVEKRFGPGTLVYLGPGSIINPVSISEDIEIYGVVLFDHFPMPFADGQMPSAFIGQMRDFQLQADEEAVGTACRIIDTLRHVVRQKDYSRQTASSLARALMYHFDGLYRRHAAMLEVSQSREQTIFDRFIYLVNQYASCEHHIAFYAKKMCLTDRYLGTVIRQASGATAKEWIDRAIVTHIKVELRHTDKTVAKISDEMNFPNPSFFCKYFRRLTKMTPAEYRKQ